MATTSTSYVDSGSRVIGGQASGKTELDPATIKASKQGMEILSLTSVAFTGTNAILGGAKKFSLLGQAGMSGLKILGPTGAIIGWVNDAGILVVRSKELHELRKQIKELPDGEAYAFKREVLHALKKNAAVKVTTGTVALASDSVAVPATFIPLIGLGANVGCTLVALLQLGIDWKTDKDLKKRLERLTTEYRETNTGMIQNGKAFVELGQTLKDAYEKAKTDVVEAEKAVEKASETYRKNGASKDHLPQLKAKQEELLKAEKALEAITFDIQEYETAKINFEAYNGAIETIKDLDEQAKLEEEYAGTKQYVERLIKKNNSSFDTELSALQAKQKSLEKELSLSKEELETIDHDGGVPKGNHRQYTKDELGEVNAKLYMFEQYPKACKTLKSLEEQRAKLAEKMAAEKAEEQRKLQDMPLSHDDLLTRASSIHIPHQERETHFHAQKESRHLPHIKIERGLTPEEDEPKLVRFYSEKPRLTSPEVTLSTSAPESPVSTSALSSQPQSAKIASPSVSSRKLTREKEKTASTPSTAKIQSPNPSQLVIA